MSNLPKDLPAEIYAVDNHEICGCCNQALNDHDVWCPIAIAERSAKRVYEYRKQHIYINLDASLLPVGVLHDINDYLYPCSSETMARINGGAR